MKRKKSTTSLAFTTATTETTATTMTLLISLLMSISLARGIRVEVLEGQHREFSGPLWHVEPPPSASFSNSTGLRIDCHPIGKPTPIVEWFQEGQIITHNLHGLRMVLSNGSLYLPPFSSDQFRGDIHDTSYHCRARNKLGTIISRTVKIKAVVDEPFDVLVNDVTAISGNSAVLRCLIHPMRLRPYVRVISWFHEEGSAIAVLPDAEPHGKYTLLDEGKLIVHHTSAYDSYKKYTCKAEHKLTGVVKVNERPARLTLSERTEPVTPVLIEPGDHRKVEKSAWVGQNVLLPCVGQGYPIPESTWFRYEGASLRQMLPSRRVNIHLEVLILLDLLVEDSGTYICILNNTLGSHRVEIELVVKSPLETVVTPKEQTVDINAPALFGCSIRGHPVKQIKWLKNGDELVMGNRYHKSLNATLKIFTVQEGDEGSYQCMVRNDADSAQSVGYLWLGDAVPTLLYKFSEETLQPGPAVSLKCIAKGNPTPRISWLLDGFPIPQNERYFVGQYVTIHDEVISNVNISQVQPFDGGTYSCVAENAVGSVEHHARLNVYGPPQIRPIPSVKAIEGGEIRVTCPVSGYPIQSIIWQKDGYELPSDGRQKVYPNGTLIISTAMKDADEGYYTCTAFSRTEESDSGNVHIQVITPPTIMPFLFPNDLLNEGMRSAVSCQILAGNLPLTFSWDKDGIPVNPSSGNDPMISIRTNDEYSSTLVIEQLQFRHRGNYTCTAANAAGKSTHTAELTVNVPPKWLQEPKDVEAVVGQDIVVPCLAEGYPAPTTIWTKHTEQGGVITMTNNQLPNGSLIISSASKRSAGMYTCTVDNGIKNAIYKTINISVNAPPVFMDHSVHLSVRKGDEAILLCEVHSGDDPIEIFWKRNGIHIKQDDDARFRMSSSLLRSTYRISPVLDQDSGEITCEAANRFGRDQKRFFLAIEDVPSSPKNVRVSSLSSRSVEIVWSTPHNGNSPILNYVVEYNNLPGDTAKSFSRPFSPGPFVIKGAWDNFCHDKWYWNKKDEWSHTLNELPIPSFLIQVKTPGQMVFLIHNRRDSGDRELRKMTAPGDAVSLIVQNLRPGTRYEFKVFAENRHGAGQVSQTVIAKMMEEAPASPPRNLDVIPTGSTELSVSWDAPPYSHWNADTLRYKIGFKEVGTTGGFEHVKLHASSDLTHSYVLKNLRKFRSYQVVVQAFNSQGDGPTSTSVVATTLEGVPSGPPLNVECVGVNYNAIRITWSKPDRDHRNGIIQGYLVRYYPRTLWYGSTGHIELAETEGERLEIKGLDTFTNYSVSVSAFTRAGRGRNSAQVFCKTLESLPSAPEDIKAVTSGQNSVVVSWKPPQSPNGVIQKYTVFRREVINGEEVEVKQSSVLSGPNYIELSALFPNRRYDIWVKAATDSGYGPSSVVTSIILGNKVRARIVSFGEILAVAWKTYLVLDCLHVGQPSPSIEWQHKGQQILENSKYQIFPNGSLSVHRVSESDQGDYTCSVQNIHGSDRIVHEIIVQIPPVAPELLIRNSSTEALELVWMGSRSRKQPILGYTISYRKEHGDWMHLDSDPLTENIWLDGLECGSNYSVYMNAYNHVGQSLPSTVVTAKTAGQVPDVPFLEELLIINKTTILVRLDSFSNGGCPISYFVIEYRRDVQPLYQLVANNVSPREGSYNIRGLEPASRYFIKVTAHNSAGSSVAEYPFATLNEFGATIPPPKSTFKEETSPMSGSESSGFIYAVKIISIVLLVASLIVGSVYVGFLTKRWMRKKDLRLSFHRRTFRPHSSPMYEGATSVDSEDLTEQKTIGGTPSHTNTSRTAPSCASSIGGMQFSTLRRQTSFNRPSVDHQSPMLPPNTFRAGPMMCAAAVASGCPVAAVTAAGSNLYLHQTPRNLHSGGMFHANSGFGPPQPDVCSFARFEAAMAAEQNQPAMKFSSQQYPDFSTFGTSCRHSTTLPRPSNLQQNYEPMYATLFSRSRDFASREELTDANGKKLISLNVVDTKYDSDSDFDYRKRPPRPHFRSRRRSRRRMSHSSSSTDDENSVSPLPRIRSIEALEVHRKNNQRSWKLEGSSRNGCQETQFIVGNLSRLPRRSGPPPPPPPTASLPVTSKPSSEAAMTSFAQRSKNPATEGSLL